MGKSTISMAIFNSYLSLLEGLMVFNHAALISFPLLQEVLELTRELALVVDDHLSYQQENDQVYLWFIMVNLWLIMVNNQWNWNQWMGLRENLNRKPMGFYPQIDRAFRLKFSHHPSLWRIIQNLTVHIRVCLKMLAKPLIVPNGFADHYPVFI